MWLSWNCKGRHPQTTEEWSKKALHNFNWQIPDKAKITKLDFPLGLGALASAGNM